MPPGWDSKYGNGDARYGGPWLSDSLCDFETDDSLGGEKDEKYRLGCSLGCSRWIDCLGVSSQSVTSCRRNESKGAFSVFCGRGASW